MRRWRWAPVALALLTVTLPALARAQAAGIETTPRSTWGFGISASGSWYSNPYFVGVDQESTAWSSGGRVTLSRTRRFRTGSFSLSGFAGVLYYPEIDDFTRPTYGGSLSLGWAAARRTKLSLTQTYSHTDTRNLREVDAEGLPLPTSGIDYFSTHLGLEQQLSQRWQFNLGATYDWREFDDPRLIGGEQLHGTAELAHNVSKTLSTFLSYGYTAVWLDERTQRTHEALLGVRKRVDKGVSFELAGGAAYLESTGSYYPSARASLSASGRRSGFTVRYNRDFGQAFGYGRQMIADVASVTLTWTPVRKLSFDARYYFGYRRDAADESYTIRSHIASAGFGWSIVKGLSFSSSYSWERNETEGFEVVKGQRATARLSYDVDWH